MMMMHADGPPINVAHLSCSHFLSATQAFCQILLVSHVLCQCAGFFYAQTCIASLQCPKAINRSDSARAHPSRGVVWLRGCSGIKVCSILSSLVGLIRLFNMPIVTSDVLSSVEPDYIIVGGGTAGLVLAARYVAKARP